ncbi:MAG: hypothetical protein ABR529_06535 [Actinomycetota bacterium]
MDKKVPAPVFTYGTEEGQVVRSDEVAVLRGEDGGYEVWDQQRATWLKAHLLARVAPERRGGA